MGAMLAAPVVGDEGMIDNLAGLLSSDSTAELGPLRVDARRSAAMTWNNLFAGRLFLAEVEARLQPWRLVGDGASSMETLKSSVERKMIEGSALVYPVLMGSSQIPDMETSFEIAESTKDSSHQNETVLIDA
jgi:hypothetical protein